jgi:hypothetical protein
LVGLFISISSLFLAHHSLTCRYHFRYGPKKAYAPGVYADDEEYFADVAKAYQTELKILYDAGVRNVQVDDPNLACEPCLPVLFDID